MVKLFADRYKIRTGRYKIRILVKNKKKNLPHVLSTGFVQDEMLVYEYIVIYKVTNQNDSMNLHEDRQAIAKSVNELQFKIKMR